MTYTNTSYANVSLVEKSLAYLGVGLVRDGVPVGANAAVGEDALAAAGYKLDLIAHVGGTVTLASNIAALNAMEAAHPGSVESVEGPNEIGLGPQTYNGGTSLADELALQSALYADVHSDAALAGVPVLNLTTGVPTAAESAALGNESGMADEGNAHIYAPYGFSPSYDWSGVLSMESAPTGNLPTVVTEAGYATMPNTASGVDDVVQAKYDLDLLMDAAQSGVAQIYLYELLDEKPDPTNTDIQDHYGLFNSDGTPKLAATAIHDLTTLLSAPTGQAAASGGSLSYSVANLPTDGSQLLFQKTASVYDIALWAQPTIWDSSAFTATPSEVAAPTEATTVTFAQNEAVVEVFDPLVGSAPVAVFQNVSQVTVAVTDHPVFIEVGDALPVGLAVAATPIITQLSTAAGAITKTATNQRVITISGTATAGDVVAVFKNGLELGTATANANGVWSYTTAKLPDATYTFTAGLWNGDDLTSALSTAAVVTVDTAPTPTPTFSAFAPDTGIPGGGVTSATVLTLSGAAQAGSTVIVYDKGSLIGQTTASAAGAWSLTTPTLKNGVQSFTATATDVAGTVSTISATYRVTIDTTSPNPSFAGVTQNKNGSLTFSGTVEDNSAVSIAPTGAAQPSATVTASSTGAWSATLSHAAGVEVYALSATNLAGTEGGGANYAIVGTQGNDDVIASSQAATSTSGATDTLTFLMGAGNASLVDTYNVSKGTDQFAFGGHSYSTLAAALVKAEAASSTTVPWIASDALALRADALAALSGGSALHPV